MESYSYQEEVLIDDEYLSALLSAIDAAKKSIDLQVYIFDHDHVGQRVADALCAAATRGVNIRILVDGFGSRNWGGAISNQLEAAGVSVRIYHPLPWKISHWGRSTDKTKNFFQRLLNFISQINSRNHAKVCIIDNNIVFIGSANIYKYLLDSENEKKWRETCIKLTGIDTQEVQYVFNRAWGYMPLPKLLKHAWQKNFELVFKLNYSWHSRHRFNKLLLKKISGAEKRIWVTNAYFIPNHFLLRRLLKASKRGVDVRILLPSKSDVFVMPLASATFYFTLIKSGISIYQYTPAILHAKTMIIDDWFLLGSSNLNTRSYKHDIEVNVNIHSDVAKKILEEQFLIDLSHAVKLEKTDLAKQSWVKKIAGQLVLLMKYWL